MSIHESHPLLTIDWSSNGPRSDYEAIDEVRHCHFRRKRDAQKPEQGGSQYYRERVATE